MSLFGRFGSMQRWLEPHLIINPKEFKTKQKREAQKLKEAVDKQGLPQAFEDDKVIPVWDTKSDIVFLSNSKLQMCMFNSVGRLERYYRCKCGGEGFLLEMKHAKTCDGTLDDGSKIPLLD